MSAEISACMVSEDRIGFDWLVMQITSCHLLFETTNMQSTVNSYKIGHQKLSNDPPQGQIISLTGLSALSIVHWKPNVIVSSLALDFEREENRKVISM